MCAMLCVQCQVRHPCVCGVGACIRACGCVGTAAVCIPLHHPLLPSRHCIWPDVGLMLLVSSHTYLVADRRVLGFIWPSPGLHKQGFPGVAGTYGCRCLIALHVCIAALHMCACLCASGVGAVEQGQWQQDLHVKVSLLSTWMAVG